MAAQIRVRAPNYDFYQFKHSFSRECGSYFSPRCLLKFNLIVRLAREKLNFLVKSNFDVRVTKIFDIQEL